MNDQGHPGKSRGTVEPPRKRSQENRTVAAALEGLDPAITAIRSVAEELDREKRRCAQLKQALGKHKEVIHSERKAAAQKRISLENRAKTLESLITSYRRHAEHLKRELEKAKNVIVEEKQRADVTEVELRKSVERQQKFKARITELEAHHWENEKKAAMQAEQARKREERIRAEARQTENELEAAISDARVEADRERRRLEERMRKLEDRYQAEIKTAEVRVEEYQAAAERAKRELGSVRMDTEKRVRAEFEKLRENEQSHWERLYQSTHDRLIERTEELEKIRREIVSVRSAGTELRERMQHQTQRQNAELQKLRERLASEMTRSEELASKIEEHRAQAAEAGRIYHQQIEKSDDRYRSEVEKARADAKRLEQELIKERQESRRIRERYGKEEAENRVFRETIDSMRLEIRRLRELSPLRELAARKTAEIERLTRELGELEDGHPGRKRLKKVVRALTVQRDRIQKTLEDAESGLDLREARFDEAEPLAGPAVSANRSPGLNQ